MVLAGHSSDRHEATSCSHLTGATYAALLLPKSCHANTIQGYFEVTCTSSESQLFPFSVGWRRGLLWFPTHIRCLSESQPQPRRRKPTEPQTWLRFHLCATHSSLLVVTCPFAWKMGVQGTTRLWRSRDRQTDRHSTKIHNVPPGVKGTASTRPHWLCLWRKMKPSHHRERVTCVRQELPSVGCRQWDGMGQDGSGWDGMHAHFASVLNLRKPHSEKRFPTRAWSITLVSPELSYMPVNKHVPSGH